MGNGVVWPHPRGQLGVSFSLQAMGAEYLSWGLVYTLLPPLQFLLTAPGLLGGGLPLPSLTLTPPLQFPLPRDPQLAWTWMVLA